MGYSNGKITAPISLTDIARAIGDTTDMGASEKINKWAKFKPVRHDFSLGNRPADWWKAKDGWCGLDITDAKVSNTSDVSGIGLKYSYDKTNGWKHAAPRKGIDKQRMLDFEGYNHNAQPFIGGYTMPSRWTKNAGEIDVAFLMPEGESGADYLTYKDLPFGGQYLGIALVGTNKTYRCTNEKTIDDAGFNVKFSPLNIDEGSYDVFPFFSDKKMTIIDGGHFAANVYTLPNVAKKTLVIASDAVVIVITCSYTMLTRLHYVIKVTNNGAAAKSFTSNEVQLRHYGKKWSDALLSDEIRKEGVPADFTVNAGTTKTIEGDINGVGFELKQDAVLLVKIGSNWYEESAEQGFVPDEMV